MSSYIGLLIFMLWASNLFALFLISEGDSRFSILAFVFTIIIAVLSIRLDQVIDSRSKNNKEDKKQNGLPN